MSQSVPYGHLGKCVVYFPELQNGTVSCLCSTSVPLHNEEVLCITQCTSRLSIMSFATRVNQ